MDFQKGGEKCVTCGYDFEYMKSKALAEIIRLQKSIYNLGVSNNLMNMEMLKVKNENLMLKQQLNQKNPNVQGGRKKKRKSKRRLKVKKTNKRRKK